MAAPLSLYEVFAEVPDPRSVHGKRHPLQAVLTLATVAMLSGARSLQAIAQFGRDRGQAFAHSLGFTREATPCCATLHYLFAALERGAFERALQTWLKGRVAAGWHALSVDGKALRGTSGFQLPGVHVLAAYAHEAQAVLAQVPVQATTNEHKTALELLSLLPVKGHVVLGDAAFCQRDLSKQIVRQGGAYLWVVKANQPELRAAVALAFEAPDFSPVGARGGGAGT